MLDLPPPLKPAIIPCTFVLLLLISLKDSVGNPVQTWELRRLACIEAGRMPALPEVCGTANPSFTNRVLEK
jgi:hypothetical protein